jgi:hypothetical protein
LEPGGCGGAAIAADVADAAGAGAGDSGDDAGGEVDAPDPLMVGVGEVEVAIGADGKAAVAGDLGEGGGAVVAGGAVGTGAGYGRDDAGGGDFADALFVDLGDVDVASGIDSDTFSSPWLK